MTKTNPRDHLVLVLDVDRLDDAIAYAERMAPWFSIAKVGYELYGSAGPEAFEALRHKGFQVFADLKLHDIPTTVERGARAIGRHGVDFLNLHAAGGDAMLRAGIAGLRDGARDAGHATPIALAVTVLTSDSNVDALRTRMDIALRAGCDGVVCAGTDVPLARERSLRTMVPGIRLPDGAVHDQARVETPGDAIARGADWLVVGRAVSAADDPERAAQEITRDVAAALDAAVT
jgi:orotidine-5'-phosphate decarboxylase